MRSILRDLPAVHRFLTDPSLAAFAHTLGNEALKSAVTDELRETRRQVTDAQTSLPPYATLVERIAARLERHESDALLSVINGTGILLHTNLGRAPLAPEAIEAMATITGGFSNLEYDVDAGSRGSRYDRITALLRETTGAPAALLVNNCAAAVMLVLDTYARGREVVTARNALIEIGGGFRIPDVLQRSGARLVEVGTTNKVYLRDYERALSVDTALLLRNHASNFRIAGFVADVAPADIAELGRRAGVTAVEDLGSGALVDLAAYGLPHERTVREAIADGFALVMFSGDKLLGGPQAGIIAGTQAAIARLRTNPLLRALRVDKATLAALAATLHLYLRPGGIDRIPLYAMLGASVESLAVRANRLRDALGAENATAVAMHGRVGGGTLPEVPVPSYGLAIESRGENAAAFAARLRRARPPIVGRVNDGKWFIDLRTIRETDDAYVTALLRRALAAQT